MVRPAWDLNWPYKAHPVVYFLSPKTRYKVYSFISSKQVISYNMAPVALQPRDNGSSRHANGKNASTTTTPSAAAEARAHSGDDDTPVDLSSADVIRLEHEYGAHK